jgi:hypothetical protein
LTITRDELITQMYRKASYHVSRSTVEVVDAILVKGVIKMLNLGKSKYQIVQWLNKQRTTLGPDVTQCVTEVYEMIKEANI